VTKPISALVAMLLLAGTPAAGQSIDQAPAAPAENVQAPPEVHPTPAHTGWASLAKDTGRDFIAFPKRKSTWVLLGAGAAGALLAHQADDYVQEHIVGNSTADKIFAPGKVIGSAYVQVGASVGLWVVGRYIVAPAEGGSKTNKWSHLGFDLMRAQIVTQTFTQAIKYTVQRDRPTGECCAFPSGHASSAFAAAAVLERHFGYRGSWPALLGATYVATSRLVDNRHFLSDVVFGAALGTAAGWTIVGTHGRDQYALQPVPVRGGMMIALVRTHD
jgi:membrane-associated phospholipid phosphatase